MTSQSTSVNLDLTSTRKGDEKYWDLEPWDEMVSKCVMPLCITMGDRVIPVGTAFLVSRVGLVMSAAHNVREGLKLHRRGRELLDMEKGAYDLDEVGFSVLHRQDIGGGVTRVTFWPLDCVQLTSPADLMVGTIAGFEVPSPSISLKLSPGMPAAGSDVVALGYRNVQFTGDGISLRALNEGSVHFDESYRHRLTACAGTVSAIFSQRFANGYGNGPCFLSDFEVHHGQSGGPVFGPNGVCGVVSASASSFTAGPSSIISTIYPLVATNVKKTLRFNPGFTLNLQPLFVDLMQSGLIKTDGSWEKAKIVVTDEGTRIDHQLEPHNKGHVYEDFRSFRDGRPAKGNIRSKKAEKTSS